MHTLQDLILERDELDRRLQASWLQEREEARRHIACLAVEFKLTAETVARDVEAALRKAPAGNHRLRGPRIDLPLRTPGAVEHVAPKYQFGSTGDSWTGRGPRPRWLRDAIDAGATLDEFLIGPLDTPSDSSGGDPLRQFQNAAKRGKQRRS